MSTDLHKMHTLLQEFESLNQSHALDHCESDLWDKAIEKAKAGAAAAKAAAAAASAKVSGAIATHQQHNEDAKTQKAKDTAVQEKWTKMSDADKKEVLKRSVDKIDTSVWTETFFNNPKMKETLQKCIDEYTPNEVKK
jgi:hypothetical protein